MRCIVTVMSSLVVALASGACSTAQQGTPAPDSASSPGGAVSSPAVPAATPLPTPLPASSPGTEGDQARIARLEREARALARTTGCTGAAACRTAPVGSRACGGPRTYIVYCVATTDTLAMFAKLRELEAAEKAYNDRSGMMSTCEFRSPPGVALVGGSCREVAGATGNRLP